MSATAQRKVGGLRAARTMRMALTYAVLALGSLLVALPFFWLLLSLYH